MLQEGDRKLFEVAKSVGYDSDAAFSKAFKRVLGVAPKEYRRSVERPPRINQHSPSRAAAQ
jgi:AraC-like DNA-binding protein